MSASTPLVVAHDLAKTFDVSAPWLNRVLEGKPRQLLHAVDGVSFEIEKGKTLALVGESGCGKSTVARLLVGLYEPSRGGLTFDGQDAHAAYKSKQSRQIRQRIQMIFQDPYASLNPRWTVEAIIGEPLREHGLVTDAAALKAQVAELLQSVGLAAQDMVKYPHQFSGGQRQRISIARALATAPEFLVCDEPTSALDVSVQAQVLNIMKALQRERGLTYLFISHNLAVVRHVSDQVGVMYLGRLVELADKHTLFANPQHPTPACCWMPSPRCTTLAALAPRCRAKCPTRSTHRAVAASTRAARRPPTSASVSVQRCASSRASGSPVTPWCELRHNYKHEHLQPCPRPRRLRLCRTSCLRAVGACRLSGHGAHPPRQPRGLRANLARPDGDRGRCA